MKIKILFILIMLITNIIQAEENFVFEYYSEFGIMPLLGMVTYDLDEASEEYKTIFDDSKTNSFYIDLGIEFAFVGFYIGGNIQTLSRKITKGFYFFPDEMIYWFMLGWKNEFLEIGFRHCCFHPMAIAFANMPRTFNFEGGYEEIFIKVTGKSILFTLK